MSTTEFLQTYAEGWAQGDSKTILGATSETFVFDDPNARRISRDEFEAFFTGLRDAVATIRGNDYVGPFMELSEVLTKDEGDTLTASCWWEIPGTNIRGSGLIKVTDEGVTSELIAYYTRLPD